MVFHLAFCYDILGKNTDIQMSPTVGRCLRKCVLHTNVWQFPALAVIFELKTSATKSVGFEVLS